MNQLDLSATISQIHAAPQRLVYYFAGAGSLALYWLHSVAGSSRTLLEARDCYAPAALADVLGRVPSQAVSHPTARALATCAYARAHGLYAAEPVLGLACSAAIATDRVRRGAARAVVVVQNKSSAYLYELTLARDQRDRVGEEDLVSLLVVHALAFACELNPLPPLALGSGDVLIEASIAL